MKWLRRDLSENRLSCIPAFWHHPRFSSGPHGDNARMAPIWDTLYQYGASVVVSGRDHDYERLGPLDAKGRRDERRGIRSLQWAPAGPGCTA